MRAGPIWIRRAEAAVAGNGQQPALLEIAHAAILDDRAEAHGLDGAPRAVAVISVAGTKIEQYGCHDDRSEQQDAHEGLPGPVAAAAEARSQVFRRMADRRNRC